MAENTDAVAVFWSDLSLPDQVFIYIAEPGGGRILVRSVESEGEEKEGRTEAMAVIVRYAVKAMLEGGEIGVHSPPPPAEKKAVKPSGWVDVAVSYGLSMYSGEQPVLHGARVAASVRVFRWVRVFIGYRIEASMDFESESVAMNLKPHPMEAGFSLRIDRKHWKLDGGAALIVDRLTWSMTAKREGIGFVTPYGRWLAAVSPYVSIGWSPTSFSTLFFSVAADIYFNERDYVAETVGGTEKVAAPWRVRPYFQLGALFSFF